MHLSNKSVADRTVSVALNIIANARVEGADDASYDSSLGRGVVSFHVPAHGELTRQLKITEGIETRVAPERVTSDFLKHAASLASVDAAQRALLNRAGQEKYQIELRRGALPKRKAELDETLSDSTRLESHVRALGQASEEGRLAARRLRQSEDQIRQLRQRVSTLNSEIVEYEARVQQILSMLGDVGSANVAP